MLELGLSCYLGLGLVVAFFVVDWSGKAWYSKRLGYGPFARVLGTLLLAGVVVAAWPAWAWLAWRWDRKRPSHGMPADGRQEPQDGAGGEEPYRPDKPAWRDPGRLRGPGRGRP